MVDELILASQSPFRAALLKNAGLIFKAKQANINEREIENTLEQKNISLLAIDLAKAKALSVSKCQPNALVIGCDQTLEFEGQVFHKVDTKEEAYRRLIQLSGKKHFLHSGIVLAKNDKIIWEMVSTATMTMRPLSRRFIEHYLERAGPSIIKSVGVYQIEGEGIQLFEKVEGDYFTIIGLPLLPLLFKLRNLEIIDA